MNSENEQIGYGEGSKLRGEGLGDSSSNPLRKTGWLRGRIPTRFGQEFGQKDLSPFFHQT
jgi:hypothetical protein